MLFLVGGAALTIAILLGTLIGHRIAQSISPRSSAMPRLSAVAKAWNRTTPGISETNAVVQSLCNASERLQQSARERAVLLDRTVTAQEAERKRIARELHDSLGQYLTALRLGFARIEPLCASNPLAQQHLADLKNLGNEIRAIELSRIAWELRPVRSTTWGCAGRSRNISRNGPIVQLQIDLEIGLGDRRLPQARSKRRCSGCSGGCHQRGEALRSRSGRGRPGRRRTARSGYRRGRRQGIELDNGSELALGIQHLGLLGVRERLALVGGSLEVESTPTGRHHGLCADSAVSPHAPKAVAGSDGG